MLPKTNGARSPDEDAARSRCRAMVKSLGSRIDKIEGTHVYVLPCRTWPEGIVTAFNGWVDLHSRLKSCARNPSEAAYGLYSKVGDREELLAAREIQRLVENRENENVDEHRLSS